MSNFISYAQNFEDVLLWRALKHVKNGFYVDIGANSPVVDSVSLAFYEKGWRGVNVEPSLSFINELRERRPDDLNLHAALAAERGVIKFYEIADTGLSTLVGEVARDHAASGFSVAEDWVTVITLDDVLAQLPQSVVHWMKIDVEGAEHLVLEGWKVSPVRPWVVVVEGVEPGSHASSHERWEHLLVSKGYRFAYFDGLNRYYVAQEHPELMEAFRLPVNLFDRFSFSGTATSVFTALLKERERELRNSLGAAEARERELHDRLSVMESHERQMQEQGHDNEARLAQSLATIDGLEAERCTLLDSLNKQGMQHAQERNELQVHIIETMSQFRALVHERDAANELFQRQSRTLSEALADVDLLRVTQEQLSEEVRRVAADLEGSEAALRLSELRERELLESTSWKMTAPLRMLVALLRGSRRGASQYFLETLRNASQIPWARSLARRLIPVDSRLKRALVARIVSPASQSIPASGHSTRTIGREAEWPAGEHAHLVARLARRMRLERDRTERH